jgi:hypothetical protein
MDTYGEESDQETFSVEPYQFEPMSSSANAEETGSNSSDSSESVALNPSNPKEIMCW